MAILANAFTNAPENLVRPIPAADGAPVLTHIEEIRQLARSGKMIEAIKRYRAIYNVGLAEAKSDIEALVANGWVPPR